MVYISKYKPTSEMKAKKLKYHAEHFPEQARILDELNYRRKWGKPIDGKCFKDAGDALKELRAHGKKWD